MIVFVLFSGMAGKPGPAIPGVIDLMIRWNDEANSQESDCAPQGLYGAQLFFKQVLAGRSAWPPGMM
jgi:hypothetical protein